MPKAIKSQELILKDYVINFIMLSHMAKKKKGNKDNKDIIHAIKTIRGGYKYTKALKRIKKNKHLYSLNKPGLLK